MVFFIAIHLALIAVKIVVEVLDIANLLDVIVIVIVEWEPEPDLVLVGVW